MAEWKISILYYYLWEKEKSKLSFGGAIYIFIYIMEPDGSKTFWSLEQFVYLLIDLLILFIVYW